MSRSVIHRRKQLRKQIRSYQPLSTLSGDAPLLDPTCESSIVAALRSRLKQQEAQIAELKAQLRERDHIIATLPRPCTENWLAHRRNRPSNLTPEATSQPVWPHLTPDRRRPQPSTTGDDSGKH